MSTPESRAHDMAPLTRIIEQEEAQREARERIGTLREEKGDRELVEQPQKWTAEYVRKLMGHPGYDNAWAVADAHNAALAAERERKEDK